MLKVFLPLLVVFLFVSEAQSQTVIDYLGRAGQQDWIDGSNLSFEHFACPLSISVLEEIACRGLVRDFLPVL